MKLARRAFTLSALALAVGAVATTVVNRSKVAKIETTYPPIGDFVTVNGAQVHYLQKGTGPDLILLHGAGGNLREFTLGLMDSLADRYTVTAFDRPGLGYSDRAPDVETGPLATDGESPQQQATILRDAAQQLGIKQPIVAGHSFGGAVIMAWAVMGLDQDSDVNASAIVSLAGVSMPWPGDLGQYYRVNGSAFGGIVTIPLISALASESQIAASIKGIFAPQPVVEGYAETIGAPLTLRPENFRANVRQVNTLRPHIVALSERYPELTLPIEIVHGDADSTVPIQIHPQELIKIVPSANLDRLQGVGHMPHHADPDAVIAAIDRAATRAGLR